MLCMESITSSSVRHVPTSISKSIALFCCVFFFKECFNFQLRINKVAKNSVKHHHIPIEPLCLNLFKLFDVFSQVLYTNFVKFMSFKLCRLHLPIKKFNRQRNITHLIQAIFLWNLYIPQAERGMGGGVVKDIIDCGRLKLLLISRFTFCSCMNFNKLLILLIEKTF